MLKKKHVSHAFDCKWDKLRPHTTAKDGWAWQNELRAEISLNSCWFNQMVADLIWVTPG